MGFFGRLLSKPVNAYIAWNAPESVKVALVVGGVIGLSAYRVLGSSSTPDGHSLTSQEKPQALRKETTRSLEEEKAKLQAAPALAK